MPLCTQACLTLPRLSLATRPGALTNSNYKRNIYIACTRRCVPNGTQQRAAARRSHETAPGLAHEVQTAQRKAGYEGNHLSELQLASSHWRAAWPVRA